MTNIDIEQTKDQARKLLNSRIDSVTDLVKTRQRVTDLKTLGYSSPGPALQQSPL